MDIKTNLDSSVTAKIKKSLPAWMWLLLAIAGVGLLTMPIVTYVLHQQSKSSALNEQNQEVIPQKLEVLALGRLEPEGEILNVAGPVAERITSLTVKEGNEVKAGAVIAYLDNYQQMLSQRNLAKSQLQEIQEKIATDTRLQQAQIEQAQTQVDSATTPTLSQIDAQKALLRRLAAEQANAKLEYSRWEYLQTQGAVSRQELDSKRLIVDKTTEDLNQAEQTLDQLVTNRKIDIDSASTALRSAQVNKQRVQTHSGLLSATANLKLAQAQLDRTIIRAPRNGKILKIFTKEGEAIPQTGTILQLGNTKQMFAVAEVYETDISLIKLGQKAIITSPALPKSIKGSVISIGNLIYKNNLVGDDPAADSDARIVEVKIKLDDQQNLTSKLSNLKVDIKINLNSK